MSKRKKRTTPPKAPPPPPPDRDELEDLDEELEQTQPAPQEEAEEDLRRALAELGGLADATISVTKVGTQGEERLGKYTAREFDVDSLRDQYGGGVYWLYAHAGGRLKTKLRVVFARRLDELPGAKSAAPAESAGVVAAIDRMAQLQQQQFQMLMAALQAQRAPAISPMEIIDTASKLASMNRRGGDGDDIERFMKWTKFARELSEGGGDPGLAGVAREALQTVRDLAHTSQPSLPAPANGPAGEQHQMIQLIQRALAAQLPSLIRGAQSNTDPAVYAQLVYDQVPELYLPMLLGELAKPDWFNLLVRLDGRVVPHQQWFEALRNEIIAANQSDLPPAS